MAPVTRSSVHGRSASREGSWQIPTEEDLMSQQEGITREVATEVESVDGETTEEDQSDDDFNEDPFEEHQGMSSSAMNDKSLSLTFAQD